MMNDIKYTVHKNGKFLEVPPIKDLCEMLTEKFEREEYQIEHLKEKIKELEDSHWKDEQFKKSMDDLNERKKDLDRGFPISKEDYDKAIDWIEKHEEAYHPMSTSFPRGGAIGGSYTWEFTPTSIGVFGSVKCSCGKNFTFQEEF